MFSNHLYATLEGVQGLKNHDRMIAISAVNNNQEDPLVLYGAELLKQQLMKWKSSNGAESNGSSDPGQKLPRIAICDRSHRQVRRCAIN